MGGVWVRRIANIGSVLYEKALSGDIRAIQFYLKTEAGWREDAPVEMYQPDDDRT